MSAHDEMIKATVLAMSMAATPPVVDLRPHPRRVPSLVLPHYPSPDKLADVMEEARLKRERKAAKREQQRRKSA